MLSNRIRTTVAVIAALAVPAAAAGPAGALTVRGGSIPVKPIVVKQPTTVVALQAGSAGIPGYDDAACESLANDFNKAVDEQEGGLLEGNTERQNKYGELAKKIYTQMTDNCMVMD